MEHPWNPHSHRLRFCEPEGQKFFCFVFFTKICHSSKKGRKICIEIKLKKCVCVGGGGVKIFFKDVKKCFRARNFYNIGQLVYM